MQVIYADILFILNLYITYALLLLTSFITKETVNRWRLLIASAFSGAYSLIILIPFISDTGVGISRFLALIIIVLISYGRQKLRNFLRLSMCFFAVNLIFAGLMLLLWYFLSPQNMYYNSGIVYFDISATEVVITTAICYFTLKFVHKIISLKTPSDTVYDLEIYADGRRFHCKSLLDTGNSLTDPFSDCPVIIVSRSVINELSLPDIRSCDVNTNTSLKFRYVVCSTISGEGVLPAFRPEKVKISSFKSSFETDRVVVAVTEKNLKNGAFGAILPSSLPFDKIKERGVFHA